MAGEGIKVTVFNGQGDVRRFVKKVRLAFPASAAARYDDPRDREDAQVMWLEEHLTGQARSFFDRLSPTVKDSWDESSVALINKYADDCRGQDAVCKAMRDFGSLSQKGRSLGAYLEDAKDIREVLPDMDRAIAIQTISGLDDSKLQMVVGVHLGLTNQTLDRVIDAIRGARVAFKDDLEATEGKTEPGVSVDQLCLINIMAQMNKETNERLVQILESGFQRMGAVTGHRQC